MGYHRKTMEVWARLGCAGDIERQAVGWNESTLLCGDAVVHRTRMAPAVGARFAAHTNLPQSQVEALLVRACEAQPSVELRWRSKLVGLQQDASAVQMTVETPVGTYALRADWVIAADGVRSTTRALLEEPFDGAHFEECFLIADIRASLGDHAGRQFWFRPPFHDNQTALLHRQTQDIWRLDLQLGPQADRETELDPARLHSRIANVLGPEVPFSIEWASVYRFSAKSVARMRRQRVFFAGDAAHQPSPFGGGRGANSGVQDANNLIWKLAHVVQQRAPDALLDTYHQERWPVAQANVRASCQSAEFLSPTSAASMALRDGVLALAHRNGFARSWINSGRVEAGPPRYGSHAFEGTPLADAPLGRPGEWLLDVLGNRFALLLFDAPGQRMLDAIDALRPALDIFIVTADAPARGDLGSARWLDEPTGTLRDHFEVGSAGAVLVRPDQYIGACTQRFSPEWLTASLDRCVGLVSSREEHAHA